MSSGGIKGRTIILARHGQTRWNIEGLYQGRSDPPLCAQGILEATGMAKHLRGEAAAVRILSSPLARARQTATILANNLRAGPVSLDPRLVEVNFGQWEGHNQDEVRHRWPELLKAWKTDPSAVRFPDGETLAEARARLNDFLQEVAAQRTPDGSDLLIVTHSGLIRIAILDASFAALDAFRRVSVPPASMHRFNLRWGISAPILRYDGAVASVAHPARAL